MAYNAYGAWIPDPGTPISRARSSKATAPPNRSPFSTNTNVSNPGGNVNTIASGQMLPADQLAARAAQRIYRPDIGMGMTDAEYRQRLDTEALNQRNRDRETQQAAQPVRAPAINPVQQQAIQTLRQVAPPQQSDSAPPQSQQTVYQSPTHNPEQERAEYEARTRFDQEAQMNIARQQAQMSEEAARQQALREAEAERQRAELSNSSFGERLRLLTGTSSAPMIDHGGIGTQGDEEGARAAAFGRAKSLAGQNALAALRSVQDAFAGSGTLGSSMESDATAGIIDQAGQGVNDFVKEQLFSDLNRAAQIADMRYQGGIQQRGQNLNMQQALAGLAAGGRLY